MKILGINHIGIAAKDPSKAKEFFQSVLGIPYLGDELVKEQKTLTTMFTASVMPQSADSRLEILQNEEGQEGPIKKFLETKGGGIHHIALTVDDLNGALMELKSKNIELIDQTPRKGAHSTSIAFIHPKSTGGILVELVQAT